MEGSLKSIINFKIKSSKVPNKGALDHVTSLAPRRIPPTEFPFYVTVLVYTEGTYKKRAHKSCYYTYRRSGAEHVISQSPVCLMGKISLRPQYHDELGSS